MIYDVYMSHSGSKQYRELPISIYSVDPGTYCSAVKYSEKLFKCPIDKEGHAVNDSHCTSKVRNDWLLND